jgi:predicted enzyme related to lactoylglutathione lyase
MIKAYDNFFLPVTDMQAARQFYGSQLGLPLKFDFSDQGMLAFKVGSEEPAIILKDAAKFPAVKPTIWFEVENVVETCQALKEKGIIFLSEPFQIRTGLAVEFEDPFGNRLGLTDYTHSQP